jgi:hypothetical protein
MIEAVIIALFGRFVDRILFEVLKLLLKFGDYRGFGLNFRFDGF